MQRSRGWGEKRISPESQATQDARRGRRRRVRLAVCLVLTFASVAAWWYMFSMPGRSFIAADDSNPAGSVAPAPTPIPQMTLANELTGHVVRLADEIGERNLGEYENLCDAADYLKEQFTKFGYTVSKQEFKVRGLDCFNIIAEVKGTTLADEILVVGAHYDSVVGSPGANDNGSGVAAMLALAKRLSKSKPQRTIRFVGFTNEEPPYFQNRGEMGSSIYAKKCKSANENIIGVLSLETMGYYSDEENSQKYPPPLSLMYPSTGNFIGFVGNLESREWLHQVVGSFRKQAKIPSEAACLPSLVQGVGWSDHWSFWQEGYVGIMITDTAPFRYPHYHLATDTPDQIDFERLAKVVEGLEFVIKDLSTIPPKSETPNNDDPPG